MSEAARAALCADDGQGVALIPQGDGWSASIGYFHRGRLLRRFVHAGEDYRPCPTRSEAIARASQAIEGFRLLGCEPTLLSWGVSGD